MSKSRDTGWAWEIREHGDHGRWVLCHWMCKRKIDLINEPLKPAHEARPVKVRMVRVRRKPRKPDAR